MCVFVCVSVCVYVCVCVCEIHQCGVLRSNCDCRRFDYLVIANYSDGIDNESSHNCGVSFCCCRVVELELELEFEIQRLNNLLRCFVFRQVPAVFCQNCLHR
jgi:hypothetical protein